MEDHNLVTIEEEKTKLKEGKLAKVVDGIADTYVGFAKTSAELFVATPIRIISSSADGFIEGAHEGVTPAFSGIISGAQNGFAKSFKRLSKSIKEIGKGYNKIANALVGKSEET